MKKNYLLFIGLLSMSLGVSAQMQLENPGFETWDNVSSDSREPQQWNSIRTGGGNATTPSGYVIDRSSSTRPGSSGSYSCVVETKTLTVVFFPVDVNGVVTNGRVEAPTTTPSDGYIRTKPDDQEFYTAMTDKPDSLIAWVNYQPVNSDHGRIQCIIHDIVGDGLSAGNMGSLPENGGSQGNNTAQTIAITTTDFTANTNGWIRVAASFTYANSNAPQYMLFTGTSSVVAGGGDAGSKLYLDDISLIYNINPTLSETVAYVTANDGYALDVDFSTNGTPASSTQFVAELSDANGNFGSPTIIGQVTTSASSGTINCTIPAGTADGSGYNVRVTNASPYYASVITALNVANVYADVAPAGAQSIFVNQQGAVLTVDAHAAAQGFIWKYSSVSGGPYTAFVPNESGTDYTPMFAASGTYYVVCEVEFGSLTLASNEVQIDVNIAVGVDEMALFGLQVSSTNGQVLVQSASATSDMSLQVFGLDGKLVFEGRMNQVQQMLPVTLAPGVYLLRVTSTTSSRTIKFFVR